MKKMTLALCVSAVAIAMSASGAYAVSGKANSNAAKGQSAAANGSTAAATGQTKAIENCRAVWTSGNDHTLGDNNSMTSGGNANDPKSLNTHVTNCDQFWKTNGSI